MIRIFLTLIIALVFTSCSTITVNTDYDTLYDFTDNTSFAIASNIKNTNNTLTHARVEAAIKENISRKGYKEVDKKGADLVFVFHVQVTQMSDIRTDYETIGFSGYGYGGGWGYRGFRGGTMVVPRSTTYRWKEGQLIIDAYNPKTKKIVWSGIVKDKISNGSTTPAQNVKYINEVVQKVLKTFPKAGV